jgi:NtrC-family two-component system response regulator AlgB
MGWEPTNEVWQYEPPDKLPRSVDLTQIEASLRLTPEARAALGAHRWPGNVRELVNALERAVVLCRDEVIRVEDLPDQILAPPRHLTQPATDASLSLEDVERRHIEQVLAEAATLEEAAARLGINPTTLWRKRKRYGIN